jgi:hypothetical protein
VLDVFLAIFADMEMDLTNEKNTTPWLPYYKQVEHKNTHKLLSKIQSLLKTQNCYYDTIEVERTDWDAS